MEKQVVVFELNSEYFGVDISQVESIIKMQPITQLPHAPGFVSGITNLRGMVLPVIHLRARFGLPEGTITKDSRIVVVNMSDIKVGMIVDAVSEVLRVSSESVEPPPPLVVSGVDSAFINGIAKLGERLVVLLDMSQVLSLKEKMALPELSAA